MPTPTLLWQLVFEGSWPTSVAFLGESRRLVAGNQAGQIFIWDLPEKSEPVVEGAKSKDKGAPSVWPVRKLEWHTNGITRLLCTPDGKSIVSASLDHTVRIWPTDAPASGTAEVVLDEHTRANQAKRSGKKEAPIQPGVKVEVQTACHVLEGHEDWVLSLAMSPDGKRLLSGDTLSRVIVWDLDSRKEISRWSGHSWNWIVAAAFAPDGNTVLVSESRYKRDDFDIPAAGLKIWNTADGKEKLDFLKVQFPKMNPNETSYNAAQGWRKFVGTTGLVAADFSSDGKFVAVGQGGEISDKGQVHLLEAESGKLLRTLAGHLNGVTDVHFSADGQHLFSAGRDTCIRVWQVADGKEVAVLGTPRGGQSKDWISAFAISSAQNLVAGADIAGMVQVWSLADSR